MNSTYEIITLNNKRKTILNKKTNMPANASFKDVIDIEGDIALVLTDNKRYGFFDILHNQMALRSFKFAKNGPEAWKMVELDDGSAAFYNPELNDLSFAFQEAVDIGEGWKRVKLKSDDYGIYNAKNDELCSKLFKFVYPQIKDGLIKVYISNNRYTFFAPEKEDIFDARMTTENFDVNDCLALNPSDFQYLPSQLFKDHQKVNAYIKTIKISLVENMSQTQEYLDHVKNIKNLVSTKLNEEKIHLQHCSNQNLTQEIYNQIEDFDDYEIR